MILLYVLMLLRLSAIILFLFSSLLPACNNAKYTTVKHIKPVNRARYYNRKKDKRKKRVKYVKVRILKKSAEVKPPREKPVKTRKSQVDSLSTDELVPPTNEPDSTGSF